MNRKRSILSNISGIKRKRIELGEADISATKDTPSALKYLSSLFAVEKFHNRLPPIVMRHQIYALIDCRTDVDKCLNEMRKKGEIRLFKLGQNDDEVAVVYTKDYKQHVKRCSHNATVGQFMNIVDQFPDISFNKNALLNKYGLKEENISELIQQGVMTARDVGCYWLSIPGVGEFVKTYLYGRRATLQYIRRTKYKEILQSELKQRKLPKKAQLDMMYHIYDVIGADLVTCVNTSTGVVLRLQPQLISNK